MQIRLTRWQMNQPEVKIRYGKCFECNKEIERRYRYDKHLSIWVCHEIPLCDECRNRPIAEVTKNE